VADKKYKREATMRRKLESEVKDLRARVADLKEQMQSDSIASNLREDMAKQSYQVSGIGVVQEKLRSMYQYYEELFSTHTQQIETMIAKRTHNKITRSTRRLKPSGPSAAYENVDAAHDLLKRYAARVVAPHRSKELRAAMSMAKATLEVIRAQEQADIPKEA
ncbi:unnamed protein product, partial [Symbiodinium sp. KB8]